ncbi:hypothetical protein J6590_073920 [Homalodisca vitripennis]|nr:hypothetical protein J6590_073920 [Homalodisca vitripennis]
MDNLPNIVLWTIRIFGGLPLKSTSGTKNIKQLTFSLAGFVWSLTLFLLQEILCCIVLYMKIKGDTSNPGKNRTIRFAMILDVISLQLVTGATFFSGTWKYPKFIDVFSTIQRLYQSLHYMTGEVKIREEVVAITIISTLMYIISFANLAIRDLEKAHVFVMSYIPIMLTHVIEIAFLLQFTHVAQRIAKAFRMVNFRIREEITHNIIHGTVLCRVVSDVEYIKKRRNMFSKITKIKTLMNQYWMLCDAVHQANDFYCDQLMAVMFSSFFHVTIKSYFFFLLIRDGNVFASTTEAAWVLTHICYAVLLVTSSTEVTNSGLAHMAERSISAPTFDCSDKPILATVEMYKNIDTKVIEDS